MTPTRRFQGISILIPGYSVEDLPSDLNESKASGLLNATVCAWHPAVIAAAGALPEFRYADLSEIADAGQILFVPECSEEWLGHEWRVQLEGCHSCLIDGATEREEWLAVIQDRELADTSLLSGESTNGFFSLGIAHLFLSILSRRLHHFIDPDGRRLLAGVRAAADFALAGEDAACRESLTDAFECLLETREQLYPVEISLADLCLPGRADEPDALADTVAASPEINLLISPSELRQLMEGCPRVRSVLSEAMESGRCCVVSGGHEELRPSLGTLSAFYADYDRAAREVGKKSDRRVWGQRRFGLFHSLPGLLTLFGYEFALHVALDEGLYPEREFGSFRWAGPDQSTIKATSRLPVAIDSASAMLRLPERLAESIQQDSTVLLMLARLPTRSTPWLDDLRRIPSFAPVLGRFVTLSDFVGTVDSSATRVSFDAGEYLPTHLIHATVLRTEAPVSGPAALFAAWQQLERVAFLRALGQVLAPQSAVHDETRKEEERLLSEEAGRVIADVTADIAAQTESLNRVTDDLKTETNAAAETVNAYLSGNPQPGITVLNTLPFARPAAVTWPADRPLPAESPAIAGVYKQSDRVILDLKLPPGGFVCLPESAAPRAVRLVAQSGRPLAETGVLRNQFFEVRISEATGGISEVRMHNQRANRVSQHIALRYESARTIPATDSAEARAVHYAVSRCEEMQVRQEGPWDGAIESRCVVEDVNDGRTLFSFRQTTQIERTVPRITIDIELDESDFQITGNPWMTYLACRFAWDNEMAAISRSVLGQTCGFRGERFESPDFIEVADADQRLLIVPHGRPFHRRSGHRMLDSLMLVEGEPQRHFTWTLEFDQPWPFRSVRDIMQPPVVVSETAGGSTSGWILGLSAKNVQLARVRPATQSRESGTGTELATGSDSNAQPLPSLILLLQETEGRPANCQIRVARRPAAAMRRRPDGTTLESLAVTDAGVTVEFRPFEIKEVELAF